MNRSWIFRRIVGTTNYHEFLPFSTDDWAKSQGATHTLITIDGDRLVELMVQYGIGVREEQTYTVYRVDEDFFADE